MKLIKLANRNLSIRKGKRRFFNGRGVTIASDFFLLLLLNALLLFLSATFSLGAEIGIGISYNSVCEQNEVRTVDPATGATSLLNSFVFDTGGWYSRTFSVDVASNRFYASSSGPTLYEFDLTTGAILSTEPMDACMQALEVIATKGFLLTVIPGINDHGKEMIEGAKAIVQFDEEFLIRICEADREQPCDLIRPSPGELRSMIIDASERAMEAGKDLVVNIDMDLEDYIWEYPIPLRPWFNRWHGSARWGGRMANIVSEAFSQANPVGVRMLYAHSAGGDATHRSIRQRRCERMYDNINILNGRTNARGLKRALRRSGYEWWRVKVFTNNGDLPANPLWSLSNYDVAKRMSLRANGRWVHLHCYSITGHSGLRNNINVNGDFEINAPGATMSDWITVSEAMLKEWKSVFE